MIATIRRQSLPAAPISGAPAIVIITLLVLCFAYVHRNVQTDDSYIFYSYAHNIATGQGYTFNPGEHVLATTSALYTLLLALLFGAFRWIPGLTVPVLGHLVTALSLWGLLFLVFRLLQRSNLRVASWIFPVVFCIHPGLAASVGMDTLLAMLLIVTTLSFYLEDRWLSAGACSALAVLSRPDALLFVAILGTHQVVVQRRLPPLRAVFAFVVVLIPWLVFSVSYFGTIVPTTLGAKLAQTESGRWGTGWIFA